MRSPEAASAGGTGNGLSISLLERFIHRNQAQAANLIAQGLAPATGVMSCSVSLNSPSHTHPWQSSLSVRTLVCVLQLLVLLALMIKAAEIQSQNPLQVP